MEDVGGVVVVVVDHQVVMVLILFFNLCLTNLISSQGLFEPAEVLTKII